MNKITAIIIDDELRARTLLATLLKEYCPEIEVLDMCEDLPNGTKSIRKLQPDIVFLDIEMPNYSGLEILDFFDEKEINFSIIYTTAYNQYVINAIRLSAIDYLLKPIDPQDLINSIELYKKKAKKEPVLPNKDVRGDAKKEPPKTIAVPVGNSIKLIELDNIVYLKADSSYCEIFFEDKTKLIVSRTLKNFEDAMEGHPLFFRCHKSYIVNMTYVAELVKSDGGYLLMKNKDRVLLSSDKTAEFLEKNIMIKRV